MFEDSQLPPEIDAHLNDFYQMSCSDDSGALMVGGDLCSVREQYTDQELFSVGGMKNIFKVKDKKTDRIIALAELKEECGSTEFKGRFIREARITAALQHPNIVPVYDVGVKENGAPYFTMKFLQGETLKKVLRELLKANPFYISEFPTNKLIEVYLRVCEAISFAHSCGVIHLDVKPENIVIGKYGQVYVCDWGIAKVLTDHENLNTGVAQLDADIFNDITLSGTIKGTPGFMSPEQIDSEFGEKDQQSDIYSLGMLLYSILSFRQPFEGVTSRDVVKATVNGEFVPRNFAKVWGDTTTLESVFLKAVSVDKSERYESVESLIKDIYAYQRGFTAEAEESSLSKRLFLYIKRHQFRSFFACFTLLLTLLAMFVFSAVRRDASEERKVTLSKEREKIEVLRKETNAKLSAYKQKVSSLERQSQSDKERFDLFRLKFYPTTINLDFNDGGGGFACLKANKAGVVERGYWKGLSKNSDCFAGVPVSLNDSEGQVTSVSMVATDLEIVGGTASELSKEFNSKNAQFSASMMQNWTAFGEDVVLSFSGLSGFASEYDLIVYSRRANSGYRVKVTVGDKSFFVGSFIETAPEFELSTATSLDEFEKVGKASNYVLFKALKGDSFDLRIEQAGDRWVALSGIQIVRRKLAVVSSE